MSWYHWTLLSAFFVFLICSGWQLFQIIRRRTRDYSPPRGKRVNALIYAFTTAMLPLNKESASHHLPSYVAGIIFHLGTFVGFFWLIIHFFSIPVMKETRSASIMLLIVASIFGLILFVKRLFNVNLRAISQPDDYFSNLLVTAFQIVSAAALCYPWLIRWLFLCAALVFLYMPISKLQHALYFFSTRIFLSQFFGKRGVWQFRR